MEIMVEFSLIAPDFPIKEVYNQIGLEGEKVQLDEESFRTFSGGSYEI